MSSKILQKRHHQKRNDATTSKQQTVAITTEKDIANMNRLRRFEMFKKLYEPLTEDTIYKEIRRPVRPSLYALLFFVYHFSFDLIKVSNEFFFKRPIFMIARHNYSKFYHDFGDYYPLHNKPIDYTILLPKVYFQKFYFQ